MQNYIINIKLKSSIITPFHSDTLWGHICWALRYTQGEKELLDFMEFYNSAEPPLVISNAFPKGYLPFPVLEPMDKTQQRELINTLDESDFITAASELKKISASQYISKELLKHINKGTISMYSLLEAILANPKIFPVISAKSSSVTYHVKINRLSSAAIDGGLFTTPEIFYSNSDFEAYCKIGSGFSEQKLKQCLEFINIDGFGRKKSTGKGSVHCTIEGITDDFEIVDANAFMSLSNYVPCHDDPQTGFYKLHTKHGKLGGHFASSSIIPGKNPTPFKYPIVMFESGSVFKVDKKKEHYGRIVKGAHPAEKINIVHYGMAYPMPLKIEGLND